MVDREKTCSLVQQWTFSWPSYLLDLVSRDREVVVEDLPVLGYESRARYLLERFTTSQNRFTSQKAHPPLWRVLVIANGRYMGMQLVLTIFLNFVMFAPHFALMRLLQLLEPNIAPPSRASLCFWILAFGMLTGGYSFLENWIQWISQNKVAIRIQEQMVLAIYHRVLHMKNGAQSVQELDLEDDKESSENIQNVSNLVAVDTHRVGKSTALLGRAITLPLRLTIACVVLRYLLGNESLLAIVAVLLLMAPLKLWCFWRYTGNETALMSQRDRRVAAVGEVLRGIRQIKTSALGGLWETQLDAMRTTELRWQKKAFTLATAGVTVQQLGSLSLSAISLAVHAFFHGTLQSSTAFTALAVIGSIDTVLFQLPELITEILGAKVSLKRVDAFFRGVCEMEGHEESKAISFDNVTATWKRGMPAHNEESKRVFALQRMSFSIPEHGITAVIGPTGSGKSLLLATMLGESEIVGGIVRSPAMSPTIAADRIDDTDEQWIQSRSVAYASQQPWIEPTTIRENILFGLPLRGPRYQQVLFACALLQDLKALPTGDLTEVGGNGVNLSGGQKSRISLARVLYSRAETLILDDIFSAVDVHTARHIHDHALMGPLGVDRTRVLATHNLNLCAPDYVIQIRQGELRYAGEAGDFAGSISSGSNFSTSRKSSRQELNSTMQPTKTSDLNDRLLAIQDASDDAHKARDHKAPDMLVQPEARQHGSIQWFELQRYFRDCGRWYHIILVACCYLMYSGIILGRTWAVEVWSSPSRGQASHSEQDLRNSYAFTQQTILTIGIDHHTKTFIGLYLLLSFTAWIVGSLRSYVLLMASLQASRVMFRRLLGAILRAPMRWIETTPSGRIMNRFTSDIDLLDSYMGVDLSAFFISIMDCATVFVPSMVASPALALVVFSLLTLCIYYCRVYLLMAREMKRLESVARSPIFDLLNRSLTGLWTIRAFGRTQHYVEAMQGTIDLHARSAWQLWLLSRWLGFRMNVIGSGFCVITAAAVVLLGQPEAGLVGFVLTFTMQLTSSMSRSILTYACFELDMNGVERILEYTDIEAEPQGGIEPPAAWPSEGRIEVNDLELSYAPHLAPVIHNLSISIESHQRIAVVGRTGAGKSSLALSLFRLLEPRKGQILIDGIDICKIKLNCLRSRIAMIPQDPTLFTGTVRSNLDPSGELSDEEMLYALGQVGWSRPVLPDSGAERVGGFYATELDLPALDQPVMELGSNFSQGQRQLLCLARAAALRPKILVMDEATSAVDRDADRLIQGSLRSSFKGVSTLLVIAHRLSTVADFDRILVLDGGRMVEFGHPMDLMGIENGAFKSMIDQDPESESLKAMLSRD
ncbi:hypothetical protein CBER1_10597 [Cercospora berteroae]|uniref:P-loop containing nucleoside triphosphate hydrolase protein n=1 Tax=Cercospora berteroae TaxID=357750 RepID=A0A2S6BYU5_9PEZI|nr:hypothetical protein CBER1_10597 [Cercospora berteroae]